MSLINDLSNTGIIDQQEAIELTTILEKSDPESKDIFEVLYRFFRQKITTSSGNGSFMSVASAETQDDVKHDNKNENSKFLEILYQEGIVTQSTYHKINTIPFIAGESGFFAMLHLSRELMSFNRSFTIENQLAFVSLLEGKSPYGSDSLLEDKKKNKLIQDIKAGKLETYLDFFRYCFGCRFVNIVSCRGKENTLLNKVVKILNELCYNAFTITEITSFDEDFIGEPSYDNKQTTIAINIGARKHHYTYTFLQNENENRGDYKLKSLLENLLLMANQLLGDFNATYRLTGITNHLSEALFPGNRAEYAICCFEQQNCNILDLYDMKKRFLSSSPSPLFVRFPLSYLHIEYAIYHVKKCGLLAHLNNEQYDVILSSVYKSTYGNVADLLTIFPDTVAAINRTVSTGYKPYYDFLVALNQISHGVLNFTEIYDGIPEDFTFETELTFKVSFRCNGEYHEVECNLICQEFCDSIVFYIVNEIIRKKYTEHQLIQLVNSNHTHDIYLFVTNKQSEYLQSMKLRGAIDRF